MMWIVINRIRFVLIIILIVIMSLQLSSIGLGDYYDKFRFIIIGLTGVLFLFSWNIKELLLIKIFRNFILVLICESILLGLLFWGDAKVEWGGITTLLMVFMFIMISLIHLSETQYKMILNLFIIGTLFSGISVIYTYGNGFVINDLYMPVPKNQIAPILSVGFFIAFFLFDNTKIFIEKYFYVGIAFLLFLCICVFRARANIVALLIGLFVYIVFYKRKIGILIFTCTLIVGVLMFTSLGGFLYDALFANYDVSDLNSVSAGRTDTYKLSLQFIKNHWLFGRLDGSIIDIYHHGTVHNYVLYTLENYGIFGGGLLVLLYIYLLYEIGRRNIYGCRKIYSLGCFVFIVPLVVSLFEYTYPYAPGSAVFMAYFCLGQYYRNSYEEEIMSNL